MKLFLRNEKTNYFRKTIKSYCKNIVCPFVMISSIFGCQLVKSENNVKKPNIIFILSDDLNWGDTGAYGQKKIKTPNIDKIANEGIKFTNAYAGSSFCAPSRSSLMEGKHQGHARVRGNAYNGYRETLREGDYTVAMLLKEAGYKTGLFGKWGLGLHNQYGIPNNMGFDEFFGYLNQRQAHTFYPEFLYHNKERVYYPENRYHYKHENYSKPSSYDENGKILPNGIVGNPYLATYSFDEYCKKSLEFVRKNKGNPFFLYLAYTIPHGFHIVPELGEYKNMEWPTQHKEWAAMVTRMDTEVGKLLKLLEYLKLDENTIIFFASDNGNTIPPLQNEIYKGDKAPTLNDFFNLDSPTRGKKGTSYDGGFRVPAMVRWPGEIASNQISDHIWAFWDFLPTVAEIIEVKPPANIDGISFLPTLTGKGSQEQHDYLYWEHNQNQAVRSGKWYAHKANGEEMELYDLNSDPQQMNDLSSNFPEIVKKMEEYMRKSHMPSDVWPSPGETQEKFLKRLKENNVPARPENIALF
jgi:arylsulfatase A-like enzyme